ncbi:MAG TPA: YfdX family protein [Campylobacteraceae bacterium]|nr:YfdX family protein [Campylobacteraceae bacterium]
MKKLILSVATAALLCNTAVMAKTSAEVSTQAIKSAKTEAKDSGVHVVKEAVSAVALTQKVLVDLDKKDTKSAIKDLEDAIGKLEVILAAEKAPKLLPVDVAVTATEYVGDTKKIKKTLDTVEDLLNDGKVQEARLLLDTLQSEIDVVSVNLPLATYPDALKLAAKYLHADQTDKARAVLTTALGTLVQDVIVVPIPVVKAQALIEAASQIAKTDKEQALKHLDQAKEELKKAKFLGYVSKSDVTYKDFEKAIEKTEKEVKGKNKAEKLFEDLIKKIKSFKEKI